MMSWCMQRQRGVCSSAVLHARQDRKTWRRPLAKGSYTQRRKAWLERSVGRWWDLERERTNWGRASAFYNATRQRCCLFFLAPIIVASHSLYPHSCASSSLDSYSSIHSFHTASINRTFFYRLSFTLSSLYN